MLAFGFGRAGARRQLPRRLASRARTRTPALPRRRRHASECGRQRAGAGGDPQLALRAFRRSRVDDRAGGCHWGCPRCVDLRHHAAARPAGRRRLAGALSPAVLHRSAAVPDAPSCGEAPERASILAGTARRCSCAGRGHRGHRAAAGDRPDQSWRCWCPPAGEADPLRSGLSASRRRSWRSSRAPRGVRPSRAPLQPLRHGVPGGRADPVARPQFARRCWAGGAADRGGAGLGRARSTRATSGLSGLQRHFQARSPRAGTQVVAVDVQGADVATLHDTPATPGRPLPTTCARGPTAAERRWPGGQVSGAVARAPPRRGLAVANGPDCGRPTLPPGQDHRLHTRWCPTRRAVQLAARGPDVVCRRPRTWACALRKSRATRRRVTPRGLAESCNTPVAPPRIALPHGSLAPPRGLRRRRRLGPGIEPSRPGRPRPTTWSAPRRPSPCRVLASPLAGPRSPRRWPTAPGARPSSDRGPARRDRPSRPWRRPDARRRGRDPAPSRPWRPRPLDPADRRCAAGPDARGGHRRYGIGWLVAGRAGGAIPDAAFGGRSRPAPTLVRRLPRDVAVDGAVETAWGRCFRRPHRRALPLGPAVTPLELFAARRRGSSPDHTVVVGAAPCSPSPRCWPVPGPHHANCRTLWGSWAARSAAPPRRAAARRAARAHRALAPSPRSRVTGAACCSCASSVFDSVVPALVARAACGCWCSRGPRGARAARGGLRFRRRLALLLACSSPRSTGATSRRVRLHRIALLGAPVSDTFQWLHADEPRRIVNGIARHSPSPPRSTGRCPWLSRCPARAPCRRAGPRQSRDAVPPRLSRRSG